MGFGASEGQTNTTSRNPSPPLNPRLQDNNGPTSPPSDSTIFDTEPRHGTPISHKVSFTKPGKLNPKQREQKQNFPDFSRKRYKPQETLLFGTMFASQTFTSIGIVDYTVPVTEGGLDLTWTLGIDDQIVESDQYQREVERVLYIGTSPDVDLLSKDPGYSGCGFYITLPDNNNVVFEPNRTDPLSPACGDVSETNQCNPTSRAAAPSPLLNSTDFPLTGADAAKPISASENSTSNCHPKIPRSNQLTRVTSYKISASVYYNETAPAILGETPIMSFFWKHDGTNSSLIQSPGVNFQCFFASAMTIVGNNTMVNNGTDDNANGAGERFGSGFGTLCTAAPAAFVFASGIV
ncbi:hypothetical protein DL98DRAFT_538639 [Cadophora sp. DSE1049]|nr:hypothetical protein DL98DRAFT_538639 [Cadophora sp. DSE1049]